MVFPIQSSSTMETFTDPSAPPFSYSIFKPHLSDDHTNKPILESISISTIESVSSRNQRTNDMEINIFDANRYFNEQSPVTATIKNGGSPIRANLEKNIENNGVFLNPKAPRDSAVSAFIDGSTIHRDSSVSSSDGFIKNCRTGCFQATPTASSEASWNSQSGLLSNPPGSISVSVRNLPLNGQKKTSSSSSMRWLFACKCPCSGKKSVEVKEKIEEPKIPITQIIRTCNSNGCSRVTSPVNSEKTERTSLTVKLQALSAAEQVVGNGRGNKRWETEQGKVRNSDHYSPEVVFPAEIGRRIIPSGAPFSREEGGFSFSFPILNSQTESLTGKPASPPENRPRYSLEVFRPVEETGQRKPVDLQLQRRLMSLPGENNIRRSFAFPASPKNRPGDDVFDDAESDSSSDLFEIESLSSNSYQMYRRRDSLDEISSFGGSDTASTARRFMGNPAGILQFRRGLEEPMTPSELYEPSEASVEWSVTTAEGFDRGSVANFSTTASEYEDVRFIMPESGKPNSGNANCGGSLKRRGNGLLGCRWENAVNVAQHPVKVGRKMPAAKLEDIEVVHVPIVSGGPPLARSHSARFSQPLVTR